MCSKVGLRVVLWLAVPGAECGAVLGAHLKRSVIPLLLLPSLFFCFLLSPPLAAAPVAPAPH